MIFIYTNKKKHHLPLVFEFSDSFPLQDFQGIIHSYCLLSSSVNSEISDWIVSPDNCGVIDIHGIVSACVLCVSIYLFFLIYFCCLSSSWKAQEEREMRCAVSVRPQGGAVGDGFWHHPCVRGRHIKHTYSSDSDSLSLFLLLLRASWPSYQHGDIQHRPTLCHPAVQTGIWWKNFHLPLAGGGPGDPDLIQSWSSFIMCYCFWSHLPFFWIVLRYRIKVLLTSLDRGLQCLFYCICTA